MAQILKADKIGALSEAGGTITLQPSILTIGGQQYTTATLNVAATGLTVLSRYQVYAVQTAGVVSLVTSQNENSVGPAIYNAWKLVGSFYTDSAGDFKLFLNIDGTPTPIDIRYYRSAAFTSTTSDTVINYETESDSSDTLGTVTIGATWEFEAPFPAVYRMHTQIARTTGGAENHHITIRKNTGQIATGRLSHVNGTDSVSITDEAFLNAGDKIDFITSNGTGNVPITTGSNNLYMTISAKNIDIDKPIRDL